MKAVMQLACEDCGVVREGTRVRSPCCFECGLKRREARYAAKRAEYKAEQLASNRAVIAAQGHKQPPPIADKKIGVTNWRDWIPAISEMQTLKQEASFSQDRSAIRLGDGKKPILLATLSDTHIGAWSSDHGLFRALTDELLSIDGLYVALLGDLAHMAIKLRGVLEVTDNILPPEMQLRFFESWLDEIKHKVAFAVWDNHAIVREETASGISAFKLAMAERVVYTNGIGHFDLLVGDQKYKLSASHRFRGASMLNPLHAQMRYMRMEGIDREICMQGDTHTPGVIKYTEGDITRVCINSGSSQLNSGYGKRYFSLTTHPVFPCLELRHDTHTMTPFWSIDEWQRSKQAGVIPPAPSSGAARRPPAP